jgi:prepilin-type N-terminal cleavage/methylation domain-containing protein
MWSENGVRAQIVSNARGASVNRDSVERRETKMKNLLHKDGGFTLIELLVVILIISILIAVSAPSFLGQTKKAHASAAAQNMAVAYKAAKSYAVYGVDGQNTFSGFVIDATNEPELVGKVTVASATDTTLSLTDCEGGTSYSAVFDSGTGPSSATNAANGAIAGATC